MPRPKNPNYLPPTWVTFVILSSDTELLEWYNRHKKAGTNMSNLIRNTLHQGILKGEPPEWFLNWLKDNNGIQPSISDKVDLGGLFDND